MSLSKVEQEQKDIKKMLAQLLGKEQGSWVSPSAGADWGETQEEVAAGK
jgi:hypothetical protein